MSEKLEAMLLYRNSKYDKERNSILLAHKRPTSYPSKKGFCVYPQEFETTMVIRKWPYWKQTLNGPHLPEHFIDYMGYEWYRDCENRDAHSILITKIDKKEYILFKKKGVITKSLTEDQAMILVALKEKVVEPYYSRFLCNIVSTKII